MRSALLLLSLLPAALAAQHGATSSLVTTAPKEASQLAFLVGQWELVATPAATSLATRIHGVPKLIGSWKASRALDGFGIEDDLRLGDKSGNPLLFSHAVRLYDAASRRWIISALDVYRATFSSSTGEWRDGQFIVTSRNTDPAGQAYLSRSKFHDITADSFQWQQDRSTDDGKSWTEGTLKIVAKRAAPAAAR